MSLRRIYNIVKRKLIRDRRKGHREALPLRIEGCETYLTPEPDEAELAAQALLEMMAERAATSSSLLERGVNRFFRSKANGTHHKDKKAEKGNDAPPSQGEAAGGSAYYHRLADRIRKAHAQEARRAKRFLTYAEEQLRSPSHEGSLSEIERGLYHLQDCVEREGGELKRRWQHCLAGIIVRRMKVGDSTSADD